jgi:hypothetical protein
MPQSNLKSCDKVNDCKPLVRGDDGRAGGRGAKSGAFRKLGVPRRRGVVRAAEGDSGRGGVIVVCGGGGGFPRFPVSIARR